MDKLVVTKFKALVQYLVDQKLIEEGTPHLTHAKPEDLKGKHVFGVIPYWLACHAEQITEVRLTVPLDRRGKELSYEEVEFYAVRPATYKVILVEE